MPVSPVPSPKVHADINERARVQRQHARNLNSTQTVEFKVSRTAPANDSVVAQDTVIHTSTSPNKIDTSSAPTQPGPDDTSTAILRPKKPPDRLVIDEASNDDNSVATLNPATRETLGLFRGDTILVEGKKRKETVPSCNSADEVDAGKIQMNKVARNREALKVDPNERLEDLESLRIHTKNIKLADNVDL